MDRNNDTPGAMFINLKADLTLGADDADVYDYVATITGRLYTYSDSDKKRTIGRIRGWKVQLDKIYADGEDIWEVLDAEHGELEALYSAVFDVQSGAFKPAVLRIANLERSPSNILALHTVEIKEDYRGRRLGIHLVERTLEMFAGRGDMAALLPFPLRINGEEGQPIKRVQRRLSMYLQSAGFRPISGSDWLVRNAGQDVL